MVQRATRTMALYAGSTPRKSLPLLPAVAIERCRRKFLRTFPDGFGDENYLAWERDYKWQAHREWRAQLDPATFLSLLHEKQYRKIALRAVKIESGRSLLFSFEKMALRDAVKSPRGAEAFAIGLYAFLHGKESLKPRFTNWCDTVGELPRKQTRVLTWPLATVFGFIAQPEHHIFLKPTAAKESARKLGFDFHYLTRPNGSTYAHYLEFAGEVRRALHDLRPRDMIDIQSFLWVQGSSEYR